MHVVSLLTFIGHWLTPHYGENSGRVQTFCFIPQTLTTDNIYNSAWHTWIGYSFACFHFPTVQKSIKLKDVYEDVVSISHKWYDLGLQLELEEGTLKTIKSDNPENSQHCLREMLSTWLKFDPRPTWHTLCAALRSRTVGAETLASNLVAKYIKRKHSCI